MKKQSNLSRLMGYAGGHKILTYLSWVLSVMSALLALVPFWYIWCIIHDILEVSPDFSQAENVTGYGWSAVLFAVISIVVYIAALMCSHLSAFRVAANIRKELMRHIAALPLGVTEKYGSGKLRRIVNGSSAATETYLAHRLPDKAGAIATPIGLLFLLLAFDWRLGLLSLVPVVLGFLIMMKMTGKDMEKRMEQYQNALADMSNEAVEYVRGVPVVKTFGQTIFSFKRFKNAIDNYETWVIAYTKGLRLPMMFYTTAINSVFAFLIAGGILFTRGGVTNELLLNLIFYIVITPVIGTTLTKIMFMSEDAMIVGDAINRINEVLNEKPLSESSVNNIPKDNGITLEHVSYSYDGKKNALNDVSLSIKPGQTVALVGSSGGGKTTLANIVTRFFDPQKGRVLIGNIDICDIPKETLMNKVSFVFQNSRLIKASILENVRMAKPDATREEIAHALEAAQCLDIIEKLPNGIDTVVGAKGVYLSGGEQQRIAIARAILKNAPIIILDEATAFADPDNEVRVQQALSALSKGKTVIMIAHRLSSITDADCIYVLQDGEIVESGTHSGLIERKRHIYKNVEGLFRSGRMEDCKGGKRMIKTLQRRFALSRQGAVDLIKGCIACVVQDISFMLPVGLLYYFVIDTMNGNLNGSRIAFYAVGSLVCLCLIFIATWFQYNATYLATYVESGVRRISLAERLRKIPLSFFGKKDLADLTNSIMGDCATLETAFSHYVPALAGSLISTTLIAICLFAYDWRMALAAVWVLPIAFTITFFSARIQEYFNCKSVAANVALESGVQECIESLQDLKSNNAEESYLKGLDKKIDYVEKRHIITELGTALFVVSSTLILKFGIATVALVGSTLLIRGEIDIPLFFMFLLVASRLYAPLEGALQNLAAVISTKTNIDRMNEILDQPIQTGENQLINKGYDIVFDHVGFAYNTGETVLKDVSFTQNREKLPL